MKKTTLLFSALLCLSTNLSATKYLVQLGTEGGAMWREVAAGEMLVDLAAEGKTFNEWVASKVMNDEIEVSIFESGDEIWVAGGQYETTGMSLLTNQVLYFGGFAGTEFDHTERQREDVDGNGIIEPWEFSNATTIKAMVTEASKFRNVRMNTSVTFDGFILDGGETKENVGGASLLAVEYCTIRNSVMRNSLVAGYTSTQYSGGVSIKKESLVDGCLIENNTIAVSTVASYGAGIEVGASTVENSVIRNNRNLGNSSGNTQGGGVKLGGIIRNSLIYNNTGGRGGGIYVNNTNGQGVSIEYCTITNNHSTLDAGGVYFYGRRNATDAETFGNGKGIHNSIVWGNSSQNASSANLFSQANTSTGTPASNILIGSIAYDGRSNIGNEFAAFMKTTEAAVVNPNLPATGVFIKPTTATGYLANATSWDCDWRLLNGANLQVGIKLATIGEPEFDLFGFERATPSFIGAYELAFDIFTVAGENGAVAGGGTFQAGESVTLTATPEEGYQFVGWFKGDTKVSEELSFTFEASASATYTAQFDIVNSMDGEVTERVVITTTAATIELSNAYGRASIFSIAGVKLIDQLVDGSASIRAEKGVYIVTLQTEAGTTTRKVAVK